MKHSTNSLTYQLKDNGGQLIEGSFYDQELLRIIEMDDTYKIEKIISSRRRKGVKEYVVK